MSSEVIELQVDSWEKTVEKATKPVAVMFYSPNCPHCHTMDPYFSEYAEEFKKSMLFARLDVTRNIEIAGRYGVMGTPSFKFFCHGRPVQELVGEVYPPLLKRTAEEVLRDGAKCVASSTTIDYGITGYA
jgi:thiol-disulfide isomerase/thioredoxin